MTKAPIIIVVAAVVGTMISCSITSMTDAQQPHTSGSKFGTIASLQYGRASYRYPERAADMPIDRIPRFNDTEFN
jgi:hypothetical protein